MRRLLEQVLEEASMLSEAEQDSIARLFLEELEAEARWARAFSDHPELLERLASQALREHRQGLTQPLADGDFELAPD
jgi:esterase/lipase superfamily enzyme